MKKIYLYILLLGLIGFTSCEDDATPVLSVKGNAVLEELPKADYTITEANSAEPFTIKWTPTDFGFQAVNSYTVFLNNPANGKSVKLGDTSGTELTLTNGQMNEFAGQLNVYPGQTSELAISLNYSAFDGKLDSIAGNMVKLNITPYDPKTVGIDWNYAYVAVYTPSASRAGGSVDWDWTKAYMIGDVDGDGIYEGWVNFDADNVTYKVLDGKTFEVLAEGNTVEKKGFYQIKVSDGNVTQSVAPTVWGVIGDATSGGWSKEVEMEYDSDTRLWTTVTTLFAGKEFKFRKVGDSNWQDVNYGANKGEESDMGGLVTSVDGQNIKVVAEKDTTYVITLDLTEAGKYTYSLEVTSVELSGQYLFLPGSYQANGGWKSDQDDCIKIESAARDFTYTGSGYLPANTEFKFVDAGTWIGIVGKISWNEDKTSGTFAIQPGGGENIKIEPAGYYTFDVNMKKLTAKINKSGWEVIGDATPGDWAKGSVMDYNPITKKWSITITLKDGGMKFRKDGDWAKGDLGGSLDALTNGGGNITVAAGTYEIVLDVDANKATMTKK